MHACTLAVLVRGHQALLLLLLLLLLLHAALPGQSSHPGVLPAHPKRARPHPTRSIGIALFSQFGPGKFPDTWWTTLGCVVVYSLITGILHVYSWRHEGDAFLLTTPRKVTRGKGLGVVRLGAPQLHGAPSAGSRTHAAGTIRATRSC